MAEGDAKGTSFEISYYVNGKLLSSKAAHSLHDSVTFDAYHHAYGLVPLHAIVSGQLMGKKWLASDIEGMEFPEEYVLDHVRVGVARPDDGRTLKVCLPAGRHTFTVMLQAPLEFKELTFETDGLRP